MKLKQFQSQIKSEISGNNYHLKAFILSKLCNFFEKCNYLWTKPWVPCLFAFFSVSGKCPQPCRNGGKCIGKSKCKCSKGYQGDLCSKGKYCVHITNLGYGVIKAAVVSYCIPSVTPACCLSTTINLSSLACMLLVCRATYTHSHMQLNFFTMSSFF